LAIISVATSDALSYFQFAERNLHDEAASAPIPDSSICATPKDIQLLQRQNAAVLESLTQNSAIQLAALTGIADQLSSLAARTDALQNAAMPVTTSSIPQPNTRPRVVRTSRKKLSRPPKLVEPFSIGEAR